MHVVTALVGLCSLASLYVSASDFGLGSEMDDFLPYYSGKKTGFIPFEPLQPYGLIPSYPTSTESQINDLLDHFASNPNDTVILDRLVNYSKTFPDSTVYQILAKGETRLMSQPLYFASYSSDESIGFALKYLFYNTCDFKKLLKVIRAHKDLILNYSELITPKSVLIAFRQNAVELFSICVEKMARTGSNLHTVSKLYRFFLKIFEDIDQVHLASPKDLYTFHKNLAKASPIFWTQLEQVDQFRIALNLIFWDDVEELSHFVSVSPDIVFYVPECGSSLVHFATKWESLESLDFLLDLMHEIALIEPIPGVLSPFAYAIVQQNISVLRIYYKHGFMATTIITIDSKPVTAIEFAEKSNFNQSFDFFISLDK